MAGFVINKFRGDASQLDSGIEILRERTGVPTLGVVPMLEGWSGDEEDSVALDAGRRPPKPDAPLRIAVVRLPFISNSTDVDALTAEPDVDVRFVSSPAELDGAAAIVLPGTKSTIADLAWLRERGLAEAVRAAAAAGTPVIGVCGGYQMLGRRILDPERVESAAGAVDGLGLLDAETTFAARKRTVRAEGELLGSSGGSPLGPAGTPSAATRSTWAAPSSGPAPRRSCGSASPARPSISTAPRPGPSAAPTCTASSTIRSCAPRFSTACARRAASLPVRRPWRRPTTSTASPITSRSISTPPRSTPSSGRE